MTKYTPVPVPDITVPEISIIIPAYGVAAYIAETMASVIAQTFTRWEAIVVNDGSPDTPALETTLAPFRDRIIYRVQPNKGAAAARNAAIRLAKGTWLAFLDGDDRWLPTYLERQLKMAHDLRLDLVWSNGFAIDTEGTRGPDLMRTMASRGPVTVSSLLRAEVHIFTSATLVRRDRVVALGGFTESLLRAQDFDLWVRLVLAGVSAGFHTEPLIEYRTRPGNLSGDALSKADRVLEVLRHLEREVRFGPMDRQVLLDQIERIEAARLVLVGKANLVSRDYRTAAECFRQAADRTSSTKLALIRLMLAVFPAAARRIYLARHPDAAA